ncbi:MAG: hypothetical protein JO183_07205 [Ktedonobacteraceae bacterium]|nr:hypothetical protein [Ktedonobacteraceae bacterium]
MDLLYFFQRLIPAFPKLHIVSLLLFFADSQDGVEFFEFPGNAWARLILISHIVVSFKMAVGAQDEALTDFFLDPVETKSSIDCITNGKCLVL